MAIKTSLRLMARTISTAVRNYSARQGLHPGDYALVGTFDERTDRIRLTFGTDRKIDEQEWYSGLLREIGQAFPEFPQITMFIGLVVETVGSLDEVYCNLIVGEDEIDLTELFERP
jgi:hypothetical protein